MKATPEGVKKVTENGQIVVFPRKNVEKIAQLQNLRFKDIRQNPRTLR